jgi:hypothetical protein
MKKGLLTMLPMLLVTVLAAQFQEIAYGPGYTQQVFYRFSDGQAINVNNTAWDLAFTAIGFQDAGIHLNEAAGTQGTELELYLVPTDDFDAIVGPEELGERLYNDEQSWSYGAFNAARQPGNPFDFGWGQYDPGTNRVIGSRIFGLKLRDGSFKKLEITSLAGTTYRFRHANLDGSAEVQLELDKSSFPNSGLVFFSLASGSVVSAVPGTQDWDLLFTRYVTTLNDGTGNMLNYLVTGTLSGLGVEVAQADGVDPATVDHTLYADDYTAELDPIGYDWKEFSLSTLAWSVPQDRAYFVKTAQDRIWKLVFYDFEGASTGTVVFEKTDLGVVSSVADASGVLRDFTVFPNPVVAEATIGLTLEQAGRGRLSLRNALGQEVWSEQAQFPAGFQVRQLPDLKLPTGTYFLSLQLGSTQATLPLIWAR